MNTTKHLDININKISILIIITTNTKSKLLKKKKKNAIIFPNNELVIILATIGISMMKKLIVLSTLSALSLHLAACAPTNKINCSDETGLEVVKNLLDENIEKTLKRNPDLTLSNIRASIPQLAIQLKEVRTSKTDPNSTKVFCEATLSITPSFETVKDAETVLKEQNKKGLEDYLDGYSFKKSKQAANSYESTIVYNLQPSDDKKTIFGEIEASQDHLINGISEILRLSLSKNQVLKEKADAEKAKAEEEAQEQSRQQELNMAEAQSKKARYSQAKIANQNANEQINQTWRHLPSETKKEILPLQRVWIKEKISTCKATGLKASTDKMEQSVAELECDTAMTNERIDYLQNL